MLFEVFVRSEDDVNALIAFKSLQTDMKYELKQSVKQMIGGQAVQKLKKVLKK